MQKKKEGVEEAKGYKRTYEGFFEWVMDTGREVPMYALRDYCKLENLRQETESELIADAIGHAQREFRVDVFNQIKEFLREGYKVKGELSFSGTHAHLARTLRQRGEGGRNQSSTTGKSSPKGSPRRVSLSKVHIPTCDELWSLRKGDSK